MKSQHLLESFTAYCQAHPEQRFWQALRNWSAYQFVRVVGWDGREHDTFSWEENGKP